MLLTGGLLVIGVGIRCIPVPVPMMKWYEQSYAFNIVHPCNMQVYQLTYCLLMRIMRGVECKVYWIFYLNMLFTFSSDVSSLGDVLTYVKQM